MSVGKRILQASPDLRVRDIVAQERLANLPKGLRARFEPMSIQWSDNRSWGQSFALGEHRVVLGHRRGDHYATHPHLYGVSARAAEEVLRQQVEGTLLHELGHAIFDEVLKRSEDPLHMAREVLEAEGPLSTYQGLKVDESPDDALHEAVAEAFRYWIHNDAKLERRFPRWHHFCDYCLIVLGE